MSETTAEKHEANEKIPKKKGKLDKYKWWLIGGLAAVAVVVFFFVQRSNANAASTGTTASGTQPGIDPATGVPYSEEYGSGMGGFFGGSGTGSTGATGPRGPRGSTGPRGHRGKQGKRGKHGKTAKKHHGGGKQHALTAAASLNSHNNRIIPMANRRPRPRVG